MKTKLVMKMHSYQWTIHRKVPNPGNQDQANEQKEKNLKAEVNMNTLKRQREKLVKNPLGEFQ